MQIHFLRLPDCCERSGLSRSGWYRRVQDGTMPPPARFGASSVWPEHEVSAVLAAVIRGAADDELRNLVRQLVTARAAAGITTQVAS